MAQDTLITVEKKASRWDLYWKDLGCSIRPDGKTDQLLRVLTNCAGEVKSGECVAILGPSGAGKTTLLNALAGRVASGQLEGTVLANGRVRDESSWKKISAYVEQNDSLYATLTVRETLMFSANMRLPATMSLEEKAARVESVLRALSIYHLADKRVGDNEKRGLSGGEKKRVAVAIEIVSSPGIIFLDEPTSGLDAFIANSVSQKIRDLAKFENMAVLLTIHQPRISILDLFDKIILMTQGHIVFFGTVDECLAHFKRLGCVCPPRENPADFFMDMITVDRRTEESTMESQKRIESYIQIWDQRSSQSLPVPQPSAVIPEDVKHAGFLDQVIQLTIRFFLVQARGPFNRREILPIAIALMYSTIWALKLQSQALISYVASPTMIAFSIYSQVYANDKTIIRRERCNSAYGPLACFIAKLASLLPKQLLFIVFAFASAFIFGVKFSFLNFISAFTATIFLNMVCMIFSLTVSAAINSVDFAPFVCMFGMLFYFMAFVAEQLSSNIICKALKYLSPMYFFMNVIGNIFEPNASVPLAFVGLISQVFFYSFFAWIALKYSTMPKMKMNLSK